ncbi:hypothetical protein AB0B45_41650 [Nonomuraea sp. NPDC049152]|uniref:hypothetical protein n=1 Tax=Nonomuraea sp. NPDC049152 TaxID=3154350 RepID=UPI0033EE8CC8
MNQHPRRWLILAAVTDLSLAAAARQAYDAAMSTAFLGAAVLALLLPRGRKIGAHAAGEPQTLVTA